MEGEGKDSPWPHWEMALPCPQSTSLCSKTPSMLLTSTLLHTQVHAAWLWEGPMSQARVTCVAAGLNCSRAPLLQPPGAPAPPPSPAPPPP